MVRAYSKKGLCWEVGGKAKRGRLKNTIERSVTKDLKKLRLGENNGKDRIG